MGFVMGLLGEFRLAWFSGNALIEFLSHILCRTYTGYIDFGTRHLFFYFFESRNDPATDDVLLWTNAGATFLKLK